MAAIRIADALKSLSELLTGMEDAYWEAASIETKDMFFDLISAVNVRCRNCLS